MDNKELKGRRTKSNLNDKYIKTLVINYPNYNKKNFQTEKRNNYKSCNCTKYKLKNNNKIAQTNLINKFKQTTIYKKPDKSQKNKLPEILKSHINNNSKEKSNKPIKIKETNKIPNINNTKIVINNEKKANNTNVNYYSKEKNKNQNNYTNFDQKVHLSNIPKYVEIKNMIPNGLQNVGEPLCMNAILQCFGNIKYLTEKILYHNLMIKPNDYDKYQLTKVYAEVLENLWIKKNMNLFFLFKSIDY